MLTFIRFLFQSLFAIVFVISLAGLSYLSYLYSQIHTETDKIVHYNPKLTTMIFDKNGELIANVFDNENRVYVQYKDIPARVIEALIAIEDTMFYEHSGINLDAIFRAALKNVQAGRFVEGASTLTQQLVKTSILTRKKHLERKIKEMLIALKLETILTKEEIIERYLNEVYFGHGYYGIRTASMGYFRKELSELTLKEIAMLVGLPKAPSYYDPTKNMEFSLSRANKVLYRLNQLGWCENKEFEEALIEKPVVYDDTLTKNQAPYVVDAVMHQLSPTIDDIKTGGYKIHLTIDLKVQALAVDALKHGYDKIKERDPSGEYTGTLNGAIVTMDSTTGHILALSGGIDYEKSSFNRATQSQRQLGSSVKPFIYLTALNAGYSPYSDIADIPRTYEYRVNNEIKVWQPQNYEKTFEGLVELKNALVHSRNLATINLVSDLGMDLVHGTLKSIGLTPPYDLSIALGSFGVSPFDMSKYYSIFSNQGKIVQPMLVQKIENKFKQVAEYDSQYKDFTSKEQAYLMTDILREVTKSGTGKSAQVEGLEVAGKTGTTNNYVDAWFCGYTPNTQTIVWYGNDDNTPMKRGETGGRSAAPVFSYFYTKWLEVSPELKRKFDRPEGVSELNGRIFTSTSPLPKEKKVEKQHNGDNDENPDGHLIF